MCNASLTRFHLFCNKVSVFYCTLAILFWLLAVSQHTDSESSLIHLGTISLFLTVCCLHIQTYNPNQHEWSCCSSRYGNNATDKTDISSIHEAVELG